MAQLEQRATFLTAYAKKRVALSNFLIRAATSHNLLRAPEFARRIALTWEQDTHQARPFHLRHRFLHMFLTATASVAIPG